MQNKVHIRRFCEELKISFQSEWALMFVIHTQAIILSWREELTPTDTKDEEFSTDKLS